MIRDSIPNANTSPEHPFHRDVLQQAMGLVKRNGMVVAAGGGILLLAVLIGMGYWSQQRRNADRAGQQLSMAQTAKQLEEILAQYPGTPSAPIAMLSLAAETYAAGNYDQALSLYTQFSRRYPQHAMALVAELGRILCQEAKGEIEPALGGYALFADMHPDHFLTPQALFGKARCLYLLQRLSEAKAIYEDFIAAHPESDWIPQAEMNLRLIARDIRAQLARAAAPSSL